LLTNLLPGVREFRTPLTVGYLWLLALWIWLGDDLPSETDARGLLQRVYEFGNLFPQAALLAALSFVAYLIGVLVTVDQDGPLVQRAQQWGPKRLQGPLTGPTQKDFSNWVQTSVKVEPGGWPTPAGWGENFPADLQIDRAPALEHGIITTEFRQLEHRLHDKNPALYDDFDRLRAEGEFRVNLFPPLLVLIIELAVTMNPLMLLLVFPAATLTVKGFGKMTESRDVLAQALITNSVRSTLVEAEQEAIRTLVNDYKRTLPRGEG
jgi:hypothetical protein